MATSASYTVTEGPITIEVLDQGSGPIIVILPSLARGANDYDSVAPYLVDAGYRVIRPQPRGIGKSNGPLEELTLHDFAADVAMALDHIKAGPSVIVGHAWGSQPARMLAADRPELVRGVVMAAASAGKLPPGSTEKPFSRLRTEIDGSGDMSLPESKRLEYLRAAFFGPEGNPRLWLDGWNQAAHDAQAHAREYTPIDEYFSAGKTVPILDLQAEYDAVVVKDVMKPCLGDRVEVQVIKNAGHAMAPEQPEAMANAIIDFVKKISE